MKNFNRFLSLLLVLAMVAAMIPLTPAVHAASASDYISSTYSSHIRVKASQDLELYQYPTDSATLVTSVAKGTTLTVLATHYNIYGYYWYKVLYYGRTVYCRAAYTTFVEQFTGDVTIADSRLPGSLKYGSAFSLMGNITATYNRLGSVTASIYTGTNTTGKPYMTVSASTTAKSYTIYNSTLDNNMKFGSLPAGSYTMQITATAVSNYYDSGLVTSSATVVLDSKQFVVTNPSNAGTVLGNGIDVSSDNGTITWATAAANTDFAMVRIGTGTTADSKFKTNAQGCAKNSLPYGVYLESTATTQTAATAEANFVISTLSSYSLTPDMPIWLAITDQAQIALSASTRVSIVKTFCDTLKAAGYQAGLYTYQTWLENYFTDTYFNTVPKWVAHLDSYTGTLDYAGGVWMWQHSWEGSVSGISGEVNLNKAYMDFAGHSSNTSYLTGCTYYPSHADATANRSLNIRQYPSTSYSVAGTASSGDAVEITGLYYTSGGEYWYQVICNGINGYIRYDLVDLGDLRYDDVAVIDPVMASNLAVGSTYSISGHIVSKYNDIASAYVKVFSAETTTSAVMSDSATVEAKSYCMKNSKLDKATSFDALEAGYYTYAIQARIKNYYIKDGELTSTAKTINLWIAPFTVGSSTITMPDTGICVHSAVTDAAVAATCTKTGLSEGSHCSKCGTVIKAQTVTDALGHKFSSGSCTRCGISCEHEWDNGACTVCKYKCTHSYEDSTCTVCGVTCTHSYKNGVCKNCGYECIHSFTNGVCSICEYACGHNWSNGTCTVCRVTCSHSYTDGVCTTCGRTCSHSYKNGTCTVCGMAEPVVDYYLFGYINGANYACEEDGDNIGSYKFVDGKLTVTFTQASYVGVKTGDNAAWYMTNGWLGENVTSAILYNTSALGDQANKLYVPGNREATFTLTVNSNGTVTLSYTLEACSHTWSNGSCTKCGESCPHSWFGGICTSCGQRCVHTYANGVCTICSSVCSHNWVNGSCSVCRVTCTHSWSNGSCIKCGMACTHTWVNSTCTTCFKVCSPHTWANGTCTTCGKVCSSHTWSNGTCSTCGKVCASHTWSNGTCSTCGKICAHNWVDGGCSICGKPCTHSWSDGTCATCGSVCSHSFVSGICSICGTKTNVDYYLFGYINGANYACEEDYARIGDYLFVDGKLTVSFTEDSYVAVKTGDNATWYMTYGWLGTTVTSATLYSTSITGERSDKLYVPGNREITFTLIVNADDTLTLSYSAAECSHNWNNGACTSCGIVCEHSWADHTCTLCGMTLNVPTLTLKSYSVSFEGEVRYNIYYTGENLNTISLSDMGLITWSSPSADGTIDNAETVIPGAVTDGTQYVVFSAGIPAKKLSDNCYFKIYAKMADGSYIYSDLKTISAKTYATGRIANSTDSYMKALSVAMLNYGAAAQSYFNYKPYNLMNSGLTEEQKALISEYDESMMNDLVTVAASKQGIFNNAGFGSGYVTASFDGAFSLNYYMTTTYVPAGDITLYSWDLETYNSVSVLTKENATSALTMTATGNTNQYWGNVAGIAAKEIDETVFVAAVYTYNGVEYASKVIPYSMGRYCEKIAADDSSEQQALAKATAVYGYYAKEYFKNKNS